jgi:hypothetical protein
VRSCAFGEEMLSAPPLLRYTPPMTVDKKTRCRQSTGSGFWTV